jgi:protein kinase A
VFPKEPTLSSAAQDLILSLCNVDRSRRLGNVSGGAARVKAHPFFAPIADWNDVVERRHPGPIIPPVRYPGDAQCFDTYPEDDGTGDAFTDDMADKYDGYFADF